ncbi:MAG: hypothetical protein ACLQER_12115 [Streptosporangiaceae bacterium]|jgi:hypothetical protein
MHDHPNVPGDTPGLPVETAPRALLSHYGAEWQISTEGGAWIAVRKSADGRHVEVHAGHYPAELAAKLEMAGQPAAQLARLQREYPGWSIRHVSEGFGFEADQGDKRLWAQTLADLEARVRREAEAG